MLATQAGVDLRLPLIPAPGFPRWRVPGSFVAVTGYVATAQGIDDSQTRDVAVPGYTLQAFVGLPAPCNPSPFDPTLQAPYPIEYMAFEILNPKCAVTGASQLAVAAALKPSTAIMWIGSNDALFPLLFGGNPTSPGDFAGLYGVAISTMAHVSKRLIVATIPDVTLLPYLTSVPELVAILQPSLPPPMPPAAVPSLLGLQVGDKVTPYAFQWIQTNRLSPLPNTVPDPTSPTGVDPVVFRTNNSLRFARRCILQRDYLHGAMFTGATVVDVYSLVNEIARNGVVVGGRRLTTGFMGGLFSLDGVHPTDTGYAVIANEFIKTMNRSLNTGIPPVSIEQVAKTIHSAGKSQAGRTEPSVSVRMADALRSAFAH